MTVTRREFLRAGSVFTLAAGVSLGCADLILGQKKRAPRIESGSAIPYEAQRDPLFYMTRETFSQYINSVFVIDPGHTFPIETRLVAVTDLRPAAEIQSNIPGRECFSILLEPTGEDSLLKQRTYRIRHVALGSFELFVGPLFNKQGRLYYEAVINRLVP